MDFQWRITSRTGEQYEGRDNFPSQELKDSANTFDLILFNDGAILAPYGQFIIGKSISLAVPEGHRLVFKRRNRFDVGESDFTKRNERCQYIIAFESIEDGGTI